MQETKQKTVPTATEIAERVLAGIESAAEKTGSQVARVWPEMVRARQAEAYWTLSASAILPLAIFTVAALRLRKTWPKAARGQCNENRDSVATLIAGAVMLVCAIVFAVSMKFNAKEAAAIAAPEGQYVREIVRDALR